MGAFLLAVLADGLEVLLGVGPAGDGHHLFGDKRGRLLEVSRGRELLGELAGWIRIVGQVTPVVTYL
jgi:hypothetical protein